MFVKSYEKITKCITGMIDDLDKLIEAEHDKRLEGINARVDAENKIGSAKYTIERASKLKENLNNLLG
jgi:hypothetical protein